VPSLLAPGHPGVQNNKHYQKDSIMNTPLNATPQRSSPHPMMIIAAIAVVLFCLAGTAAIMGWIPSSIGGNTSSRELSEADRLALASQLQPQAQPQSQLPAQPPANSVAPRSNYVESAPVRQPVAQPAHRPVQVAAAAPAKNWCGSCGNVESVREINTRAEGSGLGAAGGAVLGGLLGNQVGSGHGRQLATVAGAVGGAVMGNQVEGNMKATHSYEIRVRLDDGSSRTFNQQSVPGWNEGDRVKVVNGQLRSAS
jgi:outer membrane lipoprotein SlyB